ncbi:MAG: hypothetical protein IH937_13585 [Acidobacteria bacterium]|nr:hypothetical protein [Acidobacteriota bacterium]
MRFEPKDPPDPQDAIVPLVNRLSTMDEFRQGSRIDPGLLGNSIGWFGV